MLQLIPESFLHELWVLIRGLHALVLLLELLGESLKHFGLFRVFVFDLPLEILQLLVKPRLILLLKCGNLIQVIVLLFFETVQQFLIRCIFLLELTVAGEQLSHLLFEDALAFESLLEGRFRLFELFVLLSELFYNFSTFALILILYRF